MNQLNLAKGPSHQLGQLICILVDAIAELDDPRVNAILNKRLGGIPIAWGTEQIWPRLAKAGSDRKSGFTIPEVTDGRT